jgi:hypothetical protein
MLLQLLQRCDLLKACNYLYGTSPGCYGQPRGRSLNHSYSTM